MSRNLPDSYERQRLADEMEAQRIEARLKEFSQKPTREERIATLVGGGWSVAAARDELHTRGWGAPSAYVETCQVVARRAPKYGILPDIGGHPSKARPGRS